MKREEVRMLREEGKRLIAVICSVKATTSLVWDIWAGVTLRVG